ncbi:MAG: efflux RND transporter periplasmic adaptor subunit [Betaproteobacteria bacterium]|nr:efflux RND transporter periplasmic adaptor subunit [Betaproteobacteria bacterium]MBI2294138.1 efflux RND transporter periplasmic adaptor subunit [Betaproteobacteria bacterium]MBI3055049.1 efflux RND transporter periplasmic adaptor subunit [Betaproteobacteria bacterium]
MTRFWKSFLVICVLAAGSGFYWWKSQPATKNAGAVPGKAAKADAKGAGKGGGVLTVKAVRAVMKPMPVLVEAVGTVEAEHSVQVRAQVSGVLKSVLFKEGDRVKAGQLLFQIDPRTFQSQYDQALAAMARDQALLENARAQQERLEPLLKREFITRQEYDVAVTSAKSLEATVAADRAIAEQARIQLEYSRITAPIAGRTGTLAVTPGNLVPAAGGGVPLVTINSMDPILVAFSIPERQLKEIRRYQYSQDMRIEILPDRGGSPVAEGKLVFIDNTVTPQTGTVLLKTRVSNTKELIWPGQFVNVRVVLTIEPEAVVVPEVAVQPGQEGSFVYLMDAANKVQVQPVKVSRQIGNEVVIASGVKAGDHIITEIPQALQPGATVRLAGADDKKGSGEKGKGKGQGKGGEKGESKSE